MVNMIESLDRMKFDRKCLVMWLVYACKKRSVLPELLVPLVEVSL